MKKWITPKYDWTEGERDEWGRVNQWARPTAQENPDEAPKEAPKKAPKEVPEEVAESDRSKEAQSKREKRQSIVIKDIATKDTEQPELPYYKETVMAEDSDDESDRPTFFRKSWRYITRKGKGKPKGKSSASASGSASGSRSRSGSSSHIEVSLPRQVARVLPGGRLSSHTSMGNLIDIQPAMNPPSGSLSRGQMSASCGHLSATPSQEFAHQIRASKGKGKGKSSMSASSSDVSLQPTASSSGVLSSHASCGYLVDETMNPPLGSASQGQMSASCSQLLHNPSQELVHQPRGRFMKNQASAFSGQPVMTFDGPRGKTSRYLSSRKKLAKSSSSSQIFDSTPRGEMSPASREDLSDRSSSTQLSGASLRDQIRNIDTTSRSQTDRPKLADQQLSDHFSRLAVSGQDATWAGWNRSWYANSSAVYDQIREEKEKRKRKIAERREREEERKRRAEYYEQRGEEEGRARNRWSADLVSQESEARRGGRSSWPPSGQTDVPLLFEYLPVIQDHIGHILNICNSIESQDIETQKRNLEEVIGRANQIKQVYDQCVSGKTNFSGLLDNIIGPVEYARQKMDRVNWRKDDIVKHIAGLRKKANQLHTFVERSSKTANIILNDNGSVNFVLRPRSRPPP